MFLVLSCWCLCTINWSHELSREWRCSWIKNVIAYYCAAYKYQRFNGVSQLDHTIFYCFWLLPIRFLSITVVLHGRLMASHFTSNSTICRQLGQANDKETSTYVPLVRDGVAKAAHYIDWPFIRLTISSQGANNAKTSQIATFMGPTWGPPGSCRPQMGPVFGPWTLLSGVFIPSRNMSCWPNDTGVSWWRHPMETFSALLALCVGNSPVTGEFPSKRPVTRSFDVFFAPE